MKNFKSSNFLLASGQSEVLTSFRGPLIQYPVVQYINREKGTLRRWIVFSQGKRSTLVRYLFAKLLWDELNSLERRVFFSLNEVTKDTTMFLSLKALNLGVPKSLLRERLKNSPFPELKYISRQQYISVKGRVNFFLKEEEINLRKTPKFSGYTKHHNDKGSLGTERDSYISEILEPFENIDEEVILEYLTVGRFSLFGGEIFYPEEGQKSPKRRKSRLK